MTVDDGALVFVVAAAVVVVAAKGRLVVMVVEGPGIAYGFAGRRLTGGGGDMESPYPEDVDVVLVSEGLA